MSNRELVQQLNGALMNSMGQDFEIRADFVREIIAALSARSETAPRLGYAQTEVSGIGLDQSLLSVPSHAPASKTQAKRFAAQGATPRTDAVAAEYSDYGCEFVLADFARTLEREIEAHGRIEDQLEAGAEALKADIADLRAKLAAAERKLSAEYICTCGIRVIPHKCATGEDF